MTEREGFEMSKMHYSVPDKQAELTLGLLVLVPALYPQGPQQRDEFLYVV